MPNYTDSDLMAFRNLAATEDATAAQTVTQEGRREAASRSSTAYAPSDLAQFKSILQMDDDNGRDRAAVATKSASPAGIAGRGTQQGYTVEDLAQFDRAMGFARGGIPEPFAGSHAVLGADDAVKDRAEVPYTQADVQNFSALMHFSAPASSSADASAPPRSPAATKTQRHGTSDQVAMKIVDVDRERARERFSFGEQPRIKIVYSDAAYKGR